MTTDPMWADADRPEFEFGPFRRLEQIIRRAPDQPHADTRWQVRQWWLAEILPGRQTAPVEGSWSDVWTRLIILSNLLADLQGTHQRARQVAAPDTTDLIAMKSHDEPVGTPPAGPTTARFELPPRSAPW